MKSLSEQLMNCDRENFRRIANGMPEAPAERPQVEQTAEIFNALFSALRAAFPASLHSFNDQGEFNELRRQWVLAFRENGITTMEQVSAGL
ncbi:replication protein P, partial [Enterobacter hormaechei]|uniref:replication protein P n=2 Tax=Enterobacteriaceae TaxID=543 RepID=UPI00203B85DA